MRTVFHVAITEPTTVNIGVFSNKSIAFEQITDIAANHQIVISDESDQYSQFHNKLVNYINFTKYFKAVKNKTQITLKVISQNDPTLIKKIVCTMYNVNQK